MNKDGAATALWCILGILACIIAVFVGQFVANYFAFTGTMWWVVAIIGYLISGTILGAIVWLIVLVIAS